MDIDIHTYDRRLTTDLFGKTSISRDDEIQISNDVTLKFKGILSYKALDIPEVVMFALEIKQGIEFSIIAGIIATWLYDKFKGKRKKTVKITINKREVEIEEGEIKRIIEEEIKIEQGE